tara:strand:- start:3980 stop:5347 length:1368 start_codon:yes stop_codon:yes gene_type:complete
MKIFISNVYSVLKTDEKDLLKALGKKYSCKTPGYQFTPSYKRGSWNGEKEFFNSKTGKFGSGLVYSIIEDLNYLDRDFEIVDGRSTVSFGDYDLEGIEYRPYQKYLIEEAIERKSCIIKAPTGSGKTLVMGGLLKALTGKKGIVFFNKKQLLHQTYKFLTEHGVEVGIAFGDGVDIKDITLCTIQSVDKIIMSHLEDSDFIMFDEIHEFARGKLATKVLKSFPAASIRIGMTATPPTEKYSKLSLTSFLGKEIEYVTAEELVAEGYLTPPSIQMIAMPDIEIDAYENQSYMEIYNGYIVENDERNNMIADIARNITGDKSKVLILTKNLKHAETLHKLLPGSFKLEGKDSLQDRENVLQSFVGAPGPSIIIGTIIFQTGVDIPELTHLINARGLKSEIATVQALGRTLRKHENKSKVFIYDFIDKAPYLGKHSVQRLRAYKSLNFEVDIHGIKEK